MWKPLNDDEWMFCTKYTDMLRAKSPIPKLTDNEAVIAAQIDLWVKTVREVENRDIGYDGEWLPTVSDFYKSALFERIRSGVDPLPEPPPRGYSCPWYALVEDQTPHSIYDGAKLIDDEPDKPTYILVLQNRYLIESVRGMADYTVKDAGHNTSYRFRVWYDPNIADRFARLKNPDADPPGTWFIRNAAFDGIEIIHD